MRNDLYAERPSIANSPGVGILRRTFGPGFMLLLVATSNLAFLGAANGEESPGEVATRFVEALAIQDYAEVVRCIYVPWMYGELDSLCADRPGVSYQDREDCARSLGAFSLSDFVATPKDQLFNGWARRKWPQLFPPEPPEPASSDPPPPWRPICLVVGSPADNWSKVIVRTLGEAIDPPREASVVLDVRQQHSFRELNLAFTMHKDGSEGWRITGVNSRLVSE